MKGHLFCLVGTVCMIYSAFETMEFKAFVKESGDGNLSMPINIIVQCLVGLLLCTFGITLVAGNFKEILASPSFHQESWDTVRYRKEFATCDHRGLALSRLKKLK